MKKKILCLALLPMICSFVFSNIATSVSAIESESVEIIEKRSEFEKHFDNGDGTTTAFINTAPIHYTDNGVWKEIDNTLVIDNNGNYVNKSNSMKVTFSPETSVKSVNLNNENQMVDIEYNGYSISWDMVNSNSNTVRSNNISKINIKDEVNISKVNLGNNKLNEKAETLVDKLGTSISYDSIYNNIDIDIDIEPNSVKETIVLNSPDSLQEQFMYYIKADGLEANLTENGSIEFYPQGGDTIFTIPPAFMFDSSKKPEYNYDIGMSIKKYRNGYLLILTPDSTWLKDADRVYPIMIDPVVTTTITSSNKSTYVDESNPNSTFSNSYLKVGGSTTNNTRTESFIFPPNMLNGYSTATEIISAECNVYVLNVSNNGYAPTMNVNLITEEASELTWNSSAQKRLSSTIYSDFNIPTRNPVGYYAIDITGLYQTWFNYCKTNQIVGAPNYGFNLSMASDSSSEETMVMYSPRSSNYAPYFTMTYRNNKPYALNYAPYKYNNINGDINNFQNRMNCYAYALQVYCRDNLLANQIYNLKAGEFGIGHSLETDEYDVTSYHDLCSHYSNFISQARNIIYNVAKELYTNPDQYLSPMKDTVEATKEFQTMILKFTNFVEEQMVKDSRAMDFDIKHLNISTVSSLPNYFDENSERIIAMITYYVASSVYSGTVDHHFYVRNGNGTCPNGHGGNCSMWTHKQGGNEVKNWPGNATSIKICDQNFEEYAYTLDFASYYTTFSIDNNIRYYSITKDNNVYSSWHGNGHNDDSTGTPYQP